jgi:hypothetical protein
LITWLSTSFWHRNSWIWERTICINFDFRI